jgi:hypothetical protein
MMLPRSFRGEGGAPPPEALYEYKPPSLLAQHKGLAVIFAILCVAFAVYCLRVPLPRKSSPAGPATPRHEKQRTPPAQPIYVEPIDKDSAPG